MSNEMHAFREKTENSMRPSHLGEKTCQFNETMHLGEKNMPIQRDKPFHLGEKTEDMPLNETSPPIWCDKKTTQ
ncbi:hypothetical protein TNCV_2431111 [Trichonephila clavipes]|nr:hypothetical protein TNCV_2431111 [Trichonephila clavipes]